MFSNQSHLWQKTLLAGILLIGSLFLRLDHNPLRGEEPRRALVSLEMALSNDFITPSINGMNYYNKPPVYNWFQVGLTRLTGSYQEWVFRLPGILALLATGLMIFLFVKTNASLKLGILTAFFYVASADILFYFSLLGEIDLFYAFIVFVQVAAIYHFYRKKQWMLLYAISYFFMTAGLLTKGLPSPVFQILTLAALAISQKDYRFLFRWQHGIGLLLALLLFGSYLYVYNVDNDVRILLVKLLTESSERTLFEHGFWSGVMNILTIPLIFLKIFMPWSLFILFCIHWPWWRRLRSNDLLHFAVLFLLINIIPYLLSPGLKDRYLYPFLPFIGLLVAYGYFHFSSQLPLRKRVVELVTYLLGGILILTFGIIPWTEFAEFVPGIIWISIAGIAVTLAVIFFYRKKTLTSFWTLLFFMIIMRYGVDMILIPIQKQEMAKAEYEQMAKELLTKTKGEKIWLTGNQVDHYASFEIGSNLLISEKYKQPPKFPWPLSYYISRSNGHIVEFTRDLYPDKYYTCKATYGFPHQADTVYHFVSPKYDEAYYVFKTK